MITLTFTAKDYSETSELAGLIDTSYAEYVDRLPDEIFKYQTFFLTVVFRVQNRYFLAGVEGNDEILFAGRGIF